jgi:hypothetical protein
MGNGKIDGLVVADLERNGTSRVAPQFRP